MITLVQTVLITMSLTCFAFLPKTQAVSPPPDGGYPGGNTAEGSSALLSRTTGVYNTAVGIYSTLSLTDGNFCTGVGAGTLLVNTADDNTATGAGALFSNTSGDQNTANGAFALFSNTSGFQNTANGTAALLNNITGTFNTATGHNALLSNTTGHQNTAAGDSVLASNTNGNNNTAMGEVALLSNTTGSDNTAFGFDALLNNITGFQNTAIGVDALANNTEGISNIALGVSAGANLTGDNNIDIGNAGLSDESDTIRIGQLQTQTFIAGIDGTPVTGTAVVVNASGQLGTAASSNRFKEDIEPMGKTSQALLALKPVTFHYKKEIDPAGTSQFGLVAEDVEAVDPDLVVRGKDGKPYTVRYDQVNAMLLNEFLKEHRKVEGLEATVAGQQKSFESKIAEQNRQIEALTSGLRKVTAQIEITKAVQKALVTD
jgi:hypothetical protein